MLLGVALLSLLACTPEPREAPTPIPAPPPPPPAPPPPPPRVPLAWEQDHPEREPWSERLLALMAEQLPAFDKATDIGLYCPRYVGLDDDGRAHALATMAVSIAFFESAYDPHARVYLPPPLAAQAVGLFQLSYRDRMPWCTMDKTKKSLEDPITNLECAVPKMAQLVELDGVIAQGHDGSSARGLARYWSVIRDDRGRRTHHKAEIQAAVRGLPLCN